MSHLRLRISRSKNPRTRGYFRITANRDQRPTTSNSFYFSGDLSAPSLYHTLHTICKYNPSTRRTLLVDGNVYQGTTLFVNGDPYSVEEFTPAIVDYLAYSIDAQVVQL